MSFFSGRPSALADFGPPPTDPEEEREYEKLGIFDSMKASAISAKSSGVFATTTDAYEDEVTRSLVNLAGEFPEVYDDPHFPPADQLGMHVRDTSAPENFAHRLGLKAKEDILKRWEPRIQEARARGVSILNLEEAHVRATRVIRDNEELVAKRGQWGWSFGGIVAYGLVQPENIVTMPMAAARASGFLTKIGLQAAINSGIETGIQAGRVYPLRKRLGLEWSPGSAVLDIAAAGVAGAGLEGAGIGIGRGWSAMVDAVGGTKEMARILGQHYELGQPAAELIAEAAEMGARNPFPDILGSALKHLETAEGAARALPAGERPPSLIETIEAREAELARQEAELESEVGQGEIDAEAQAGGTASNWALNVARRGLSEAFGVEVKGERIQTDRGPGVRLEGPDGQTLDIVDADGVQAAREAVDHLTDQMGVDRVPLSRRELSAGRLDIVRRERRKIQSELERVRVETSRIVGDAMGQPGGRVFKTKKAAAAWARRNNLGEFEVIKRKRGFLVRQLEPPAPGASPVRALPADVLPQLRETIARVLPQLPAEQHEGVARMFAAGIENLARVHGISPQELLSRMPMRASEPGDVSGGALFQAEGLLRNLVKAAKKAGVDRVKAPKGKAKERIRAVAEWLTGWNEGREIIPRDLVARLKAKGKSSPAELKTFEDALYRHTVREMKAWIAIREGYEGFYDVNIHDFANPALQDFALDRFGRKLRNEEVQLFHLFSALASPQNMPQPEAVAGMEVFERFIRTNLISAKGRRFKHLYADDKKTKLGRVTDEDGNPEFTRTAPKYEESALNKLVDLYHNRFKGDLKAMMGWLQERHSYAELAEAVGKGTKADKKLGILKLELHENLTAKGDSYGIFALAGPKLGSYWLNRIGNLTTVTKDLWYARTMARLLGDPLIDMSVKDSKPVAEPFPTTVAGTEMRTAADKAWKRAAKALGKLEEFQNLTIKDKETGERIPIDVAHIQQWMWDMEKFLWFHLGGDPSDAGVSISDGIAEAARFFGTKSEVGKLPSVADEKFRRVGSLAYEGPAREAILRGGLKTVIRDLELAIEAKTELDLANGREPKVAGMEERLAQHREQLEYRELLAREAGEDGPLFQLERPMTRAEFLKTYYVHTDLRGREKGTASQNAARIMEEGFGGSRGPNALPIVVDAKGATTNDWQWPRRAGDVVYFVPKKEWIIQAGNGPKVRPGWKPKQHEVVGLTSDDMDLYEAYLSAWNKEHGVPEGRRGRFLIVGSRGRGDNKPGSDFDLVTELTPEEDAAFNKNTKNLPQEILDAARAIKGEEGQTFIISERGGVRRLWQIRVSGRTKLRVDAEVVGDAGYAIVSGLRKEPFGRNVYSHTETRHGHQVRWSNDRPGFGKEGTGGYLGGTRFEGGRIFDSADDAIAEARRLNSEEFKRTGIPIYVDPEFKLDMVAERLAKQRAGLFQGAGGIIRGALEWEDDQRALMHMMADANASTPLHEFAHFFRRYLPEQDMRIAEEWAGVEPGQKWSIEAEEKFADGFLEYVAEGVAPTRELESVFARFKKWIADLADAAFGKRVELTDAVRGVFDRVLGADATTPAKEFAARMDTMDTPATKSAAEAARFAERKTGRDMTMGEVDEFHADRSTGQGQTAGDLLEAEDQAMVESITEDDLVGELGDVESDRVVRDSKGVAATRTVREVVEQADSEIDAIRAIRECQLGG